MLRYLIRNIKPGRCHLPYRPSSSWREYELTSTR